MPELEENSVDSIVTDPPYHLTMTKRLANSNAGDVERNFTKTIPGQGTNPYRAAATGFMGKSWDGGDVAFQPETWAKAMRLLKPGGYLLAMGGTRTYHRLVCAIEDAGFEIRDSIAWVYGSGFPKSLDVAKSIDKAARGVPQGGPDPTSENHGNYKGGCSEDNPIGQGFGAGPGQFMKDSRSKYDGANRKPAPSTSNGFGYESKGGILESRPLTEDAQQWDGWGTALKPAMELVVVARKPISEKTIASNVLKWGTGAINIDGCRIEGEPVPINKLKQWSGFGQEKRPDYEQEMNTLGRWPSNVIHDGSDEVLASFPDSDGQQGFVGERHGDRDTVNCYGNFGPRPDTPPRGDSGSSARFFYCAKASGEDRNEGCEHIEPKQYSHDGRETPNDNAYQRNSSNSSNSSNSHPTVKPTALMRYLVKLVTPPNGTVLDPFTGSGSTGKAALYEGFKFIGIEGEEEYCAIAKARIQFVLENDSPLFRTAEV
jgi:site-specific DNA-methyltransferase (adenine-specific)